MSILYQTKIEDYERLLIDKKDTTEIDKAIGEELGSTENVKLFLLLKDEILLLHRIEIAKIEGKDKEFEKLTKIFEKAHKKVMDAMPKEKDRYKTFVSWRNAVEKWRGSPIAGDRNMFYLCEATKTMRADFEQQK